MNSPRALGYRMPAEWEPHEATWLSWPKDPETFPADILPEVEAAYGRMIESLLPHEKVHLFVDDEAARRQIVERLPGGAAKSEGLLIHRIPTVDVWLRDYGPTFLVRDGDRGRERAFVRWEFNAWGNKYAELLPDGKVPEAMEGIGAFPVFRPGLILEGGSIDVNGAGAVLTTEQCLLNRNRNPHLSRAAIEEALKSNLGVDEVLWLGKGIAGDDTDGHIDDLARFTGPRTIVCAEEKTPGDENHAPLQDGLARLREIRDNGGRPFDVVPLPMPEPVRYRGRRLPASHTNFYVGNGIVLVPVFRGPSDDRALGILRDLFFRREVIGIDCRAMVAGLGAIHCVTQQEPAAAPAGGESAHPNAKFKVPSSK